MTDLITALESAAKVEDAAFAIQMAELRHTVELSGAKWIEPPATEHVNATLLREAAALIRKQAERILVLEETVKWRPIESAPKDGPDKWSAPRILLLVPCVPKSRVVIGRWDADTYSKKPKPFWATDGVTGKTWDREHQPTRWQPLPAPPAGEGQ